MSIWDRILRFMGPTASNAPVSFGYKTAWIAADADPNEAIAALGLLGAEPSSWSRGLYRARSQEVFVAPRIGRWTLAVAAHLAPPSESYPDPFSRWFAGVGSALGSEVQAFWSHRGSDSYGWARTRGGAIERVYYTTDGRTLAQVGLPCTREDAMGIDYPPSRDDPPEAHTEWARSGRKRTPNEGTVCTLAGRWSLNPAHLERNPRFPQSDGVVGRLPP